MPWPSPAAGTLRPFPRADDAFLDPRTAERVLAPLLSVDLGALNPEWDGWLPVVAPYEPIAGLLGERAADVHTSFCRPGWLGFRLGDDGRLDFLGDWNLFEWFRSPGRVRAHYEDQLAGFAEARDTARPDEWLTEAASEQSEFAWWVEAEGFETEGVEDGDAHPVMPNGDRFFHVLSLRPADYLPRGAEELAVFYEPRSRTVLVAVEAIA